MPLILYQIQLFTIENQTFNIESYIHSQLILYFNHQQSLMLRKFSYIPRFFFASEGAKSVPGHKPPAIADNVAGRYAGSLFTSASKFQALDVVLKDVTHLSKVIAEQSLIREFLKNSAIKRNQQREIIGSFAPQQYHQITNNFLQTLIDSGRLSDLQKIIQTFVSYCKILNKEEDIKIISAKDLTDGQKEQVIKSIKKNKPDVRFKITYETDPAILGGLQIYAGTQFLDCSLRSRIEKLKTELGRIA